MTVRFHRLVQRDVWQIMRYYERESGVKLADEFYDEFLRKAQESGANPNKFHFDSSGLRRAQLRRFPYHLLFRIREQSIFILVLRHDRRHPSYGVRRKS